MRGEQQHRTHETSSWPEPHLEYTGADADELTFVLTALHDWLNGPIQSIADWSEEHYGDPTIGADVLGRLEQLAAGAAAAFDSEHPTTASDEHWSAA